MTVTPPAMAVAGARHYASLDVRRGVALVSMVSTHVTNGAIRTLSAGALHAGRWIDGAFLFVALSGVVVGLVHRRLVDHGGVGRSARKLLRRAGVLYVAHLVVTLLLIEANTRARDAKLVDLPTWQVYGVPDTVWRTATMRIESEILPMYALLLVGAIGVFALLARGRADVVVSLSLAVYALGALRGGITIAPGAFHLDAWQLLFVAGLLVGWTWEHERGRLPQPWRRAVVQAAVGACFVLLILARIITARHIQLPPWVADKAAGGLLAFLFCGAALVVGHTVFERVGHTSIGRSALVPLRILGSRGLPGYLTMVLAVAAISCVPGIPRNDLTVLGIVVLCGAAEQAAVLLSRVDHTRPVLARRSRHVGGHR